MKAVLYLDNRENSERTFPPYDNDLVRIQMDGKVDRILEAIDKLKELGYKLE